MRLSIPSQEEAKLSLRRRPICRQLDVQHFNSISSHFKDHHGTLPNGNAFLSIFASNTKQFVPRPIVPSEFGELESLYTLSLYSGRFRRCCPVAQRPPASHRGCQNYRKRTEDFSKRSERTEESHVDGCGSRIVFLASRGSSYWPGTGVLQEHHLSPFLFRIMPLGLSSLPSRPSTSGRRLMPGIPAQLMNRASTLGGALCISVQLSLLSTCVPNGVLIVYFSLQAGWWVFVKEKDKSSRNISEHLSGPFIQPRCLGPCWLLSMVSATTSMYDQG